MSNRVIKFRAFNSEDNEMYSDTVAKLLLYKESIGDAIPGKWNIMQFTGLPDSKGVEIYVGDFISVKQFAEFGGEFEDLNGEITFIDGGFCVEDENFPDGFGVIPLSAINTKNSTVIGNLHQHPELLKD